MTASAFDRMLDELQRQRDELNLQMRLAKAEARVEWERREKKWQKTKPKLDAASGEALEAGENVQAGLKLTVGELRKGGYERIRSQLR